MASDAFTASRAPLEAVQICFGGPIGRPPLATGLNYMTYPLTEALASAFL